MVVLYNLRKGCSAPGRWTKAQRPFGAGKPQYGRFMTAEGLLARCYSAPAGSVNNTAKLVCIVSEGVVRCREPLLV